MTLVEFDFERGSSHRTTNLETPEGDVSAIQSGRFQPLPTYSEHGDPLSRPLISTVDPLDTRHIPPTYEEQQSQPNISPQDTEGDQSTVSGRSSIDRPESFPSFDDEDIQVVQSNRNEEAEVANEKRNVIIGFFEAIRKEQGDVVDLFLSRDLVTANTTDEDGMTPLLAAVKTKNIKIVQQLLDAGAEPDAFGVESKVYDRHERTSYFYTKRTPLMVAASIGHLPLVKLLHGNYACNDGLVAPDGQIALRLAASAGHREVVDYLPSRRAGGFLRWKTTHRRSLARARRALYKMYRFVKFFVWDIEKFFLWTVPKHLVVRPLKKLCVYCWTNKERFADWCICEIKKGPERTKRAAKAWGRALAKVPKLVGDAGKACGRGLAKIPKVAGNVGKACWRGAKKIPGATVTAAKWTRDVVVDVAKACWEFLTVTLPRVVKKLSLWIFDILFVRLPKAVGVAAKWLWGGIVTICQALWNVLTRIISAIHTFVTSLSLSDVINAVKHVFGAIFVTFPQMVWGWIKRFGEMSFTVLEVSLGCVGIAIWWVIRGIIYLVNYLPRKLWEVIVAMGESMGKGMHEILVWFRPKA